MEEQIEYITSLPNAPDVIINLRVRNASRESESGRESERERERGGSREGE